MSSSGNWGRRLPFSFLCILYVTSCSAEKSQTQGSYIENAARGGGNANAIGQPTTGDVGAGGVTATSATNSGGATGGAINTNPIGDICAGVHVQASRIKPWIMFVVDRSGSTDEEYPGSSSKWQAMYDALMTPKTGVIDKLQSVAYFGMLLFDGGDQVNLFLCTLLGNCPDAGAGECPRLVTVNPALNNYNAIDDKYRQSPPGSSTPAALALEAAYKLAPSQQQVLDKVIGPQFVIYCTDGQPNTCENGSATDDPAARQAVLGHVTAAAKAGTKTYVIGIAVNDEAKAHLTEVAKAGNTGSPAFSPSSKDELTKVISQIVGGSVGCNLQLNNSVTPGKECLGTVELNSRPLTCNDPNGWKLADATHIQLLGTACDSFINDTAAILNAGFPCDALVLQ